MIVPINSAKTKILSYIIIKIIFYKILENCPDKKCPDKKHVRRLFDFPAEMGASVQNQPKNTVESEDIQPAIDKNIEQNSEGNLK